MDVATCAWEDAGSPAHSLPTGQGGRCARCAAQAVLVRTRKVVSGNFTGWEGWADPSAFGLCPACVWLYRTPWLRAGPMLVKPGHTKPLSLPELGHLLNQPIPTSQAVIVPLRSGRKHVLPLAVWGRVQVDDTSMHWTDMDAYRITVMRRLRSIGFGSNHLAQPSPPWPVVRRVDPSTHAGILADWRQLDPWRASATWLKLATLATTRPSTTTRKAA